MLGCNTLRSGALAALILLLANSAWGQAAPNEGPRAKDALPKDEARLRFTFERAPWRSVLSWIAEESQMALYVSELPTGTFTYSDPKLYTPGETIDRINLFLIPEGFTFVRSGQLLSLITLGDPRSMKQLDAMAQLVELSDLDQRGAYEVVKCILPLGKLEAQTALAELNSLGLIAQPIVLSASNQLLLTETAGKLRTAKRVLDALDNQDGGDELVKSFVLKHATTDDVLAVARPHLGIEADEMSGFDVSLSSDIKGKKLFASGSRQSIELLETLVEVVDRPEEGELKDRVLRSHPVSGENLQTVYAVLLTLLADQSIRLSEDEDTNSIVALAPVEVHEHIERTIEELDGPGREFSIIELKTLDPYAVMTLLNQLFGAEAAAGGDDDWDWWDWRRRSRDRDEDETKDAPKIHADLQRKRLLVRGTPAQIEEIKRVVAQLEKNETQLENVRVLPGLGTQSVETLELARQLWRGKNPLFVVPGPASGSSVNERTAHPETKDAAPGPKSGDSTSLGGQPTIPTQLVTEGASPSDSGAAPIQIRITPGGIVLESDDTEALAEFEAHLRRVAQLGGAIETPEPVIFYLKYATADEATKMLADLLDGASWLSSSSEGYLGSGDTTSSGGSQLGSMLLTREGSTTMTAGSATVVSDARLNRLIVQGTAEDVALIEGYLKIIDKDTSITSIETRGRTRLVALAHASATEVAQVIREAYGSRIAGSTQQQQQANQRNGNDRNRRDEAEGRRDREDDDPRRRNQTREAKNREAEMTLAVHEASNSLILTAPDALFQEVDGLVQLLDRRAQRSMEIVIPKSMSGRHIGVMLHNALLEQGAQAISVPENGKEGGGSGPARTDGRGRGRGRNE